MGRLARATGALPTDDLLEEIEEFHANLKAALEWSADQPELGLRLLRGVAITWEDLGRAGDAMATADRLLNEENTDRYDAAWLAAAQLTSFLCFEARAARTEIASGSWSASRTSPLGW